MKQKLTDAIKEMFSDIIHVRLVYEKKNYIFLAVALVIAILLYIATGYMIWIIPLFGGVFYLLRSLKLTLSTKLPWIWTAILFIPSAIFTTFCVQYVILDDSLFSKLSTTKWIINIVCVLAVYLVTLLFTNRPAVSCVISHVFFTLVGFIDYFVYLFRQNEFTFADLRAMGTGLSVAGNYTFTLTVHSSYVILLSILYITLVLKCHVRFKERLHMSILTVLMTVVCCLYVGNSITGYSTETWEQKGTYRNGYVMNFVLEIRDSFISEPDGYSTDEITALETMYDGDDAGSTDAADEALTEAGTETDVVQTTDTLTEDPTIIVIMNESFADLSILGDLQTNLPVMPFFDSLEENTIKGYALSSVFGAKTPNSEWEFLTGNSMAFLPSGSVVYQQYINKQPTSLVSTLKNIGYTCVAMHPYYASGWSRDAVYPKLGFDEMHFIDDFDQTQIIRKYITDQELYDKLIERYEARQDGEKLFLFGVTMQNHGGYTTTYDNFEENYYKTGTSYTDLNQYLSLVHESDVALENLITYFEGVDDPVEIVFFGDHQPSLNSGFYKMMNGKGLSGLTKEELMQMYKVPFLIWTNYESEAKTVEVTSLNFLSTMALERAGIELPAYNQFIADLMEVVPAINSRGYYSLSEGKYKNIDDATGDEATWIQYYRILQYNSMFDKKNRSELFFPYLLDAG